MRECHRSGYLSERSEDEKLGNLQPSQNAKQLPRFSFKLYKSPKWIFGHESVE
jgi:hypothetical protein